MSYFKDATNISAGMIDAWQEIRKQDDIKLQEQIKSLIEQGYDDKKIAAKLAPLVLPENYIPAVRKQLDELSRKTLGSYVKGAVNRLRDIDDQAVAITANRHAPLSKAAGDEYNRLCRQGYIKKRGIDTAINKLTKEENTTTTAYQSVADKNPLKKEIASLKSARLQAGAKKLGNIAAKPMANESVDDLFEQFLDEGVTTRHLRDNIIADHIEQNKKEGPGIFTFRDEYFYRHGKTPEGHAKGISNQLTKHGIKHEVLDKGDHWAPFKGGASTKASSHFWTKVKIHESLDEAKTGSSGVTVSFDVGDRLKTFSGHEGTIEKIANKRPYHISLRTTKGDLVNIDQNDIKHFIDEAVMHDKAVHVILTNKKKGGLPAYRVTAIGPKVRGIKVGEHLTDTELDDAREGGHKIRTSKANPIKENFLGADSTWLGQFNQHWAPNQLLDFANGDKVSVTDTDSNHFGKMGTITHTESGPSGSKWYHVQHDDGTTAIHHQFGIAKHDMRQPANDNDVQEAKFIGSKFMSQGTPPAPELNTYRNTPENAEKYGWNKVPEYTRGDPKHPYVVHDHYKGRFWYSDRVWKPGKLIEDTNTADIGTLPKTPTAARVLTKKSKQAPVNLNPTMGTNDPAANQVVGVSESADQYAKLIAHHENMVQHHDQFNTDAHGRAAAHHQQAAYHYTRASHMKALGNEAEEEMHTTRAERYADGAEELEREHRMPLPRKVTEGWKGGAVTGAAIGANFGALAGPVGAAAGAGIGAVAGGALQHFAQKAKDHKVTPLPATTDQRAAARRRALMGRIVATVASKGSKVVNESKNNYHSVFYKDPDGQWNHDFDHDEKGEADDNVRGIKMRGQKAVRLVVPKEEARWNHMTGDQMHNYVEQRIKPKNKNG